MPYQTTPLSVYTRRYQPRHPLAQHAIRQIDAKQLRPQDIIRAMGYPLRHTLPACERLRHVLSDRYLGLDNSYVDSYFSAPDFLTTLLAVLDLSCDDFEDDIARIQYNVEHLSRPLQASAISAKSHFDFESVTWQVCRDHTSA